MSGIKHHKNKYSLSTLMIFVLLSFLLVYIPKVDARAGGGGGGGGGFHSSSSSFRSGGKGKPFKLSECTMVLACKSIYKNYGVFPVFFLLLSFILFHILNSILLDIYLKAEGNRDHLYCALIYFVVFLLLHISLVIRLFLLLFEIMQLNYCIRCMLKYGRVLSSEECMRIEFREKYYLNEEDTIKALKVNNPSFSLVKLKNRINKAFRIIQETWMEQDLSDAEMFLADGTYEQFQIQINGMKANKTKDFMRNLKILNMGIVKIESSEFYDSMYVAIRANAINYLQDLKTLTIIKGSVNFPETFAEIWCFIRRKGAKTINDKGLIEGYCPNCGTKLEGSRLIKCPCCDSLLKSGQHDWILAGIYQTCGWRDTHNSFIPGLKNLYILDPSFNIQNIEDKLSAVFWRVIQAVRTKSEDSLLKISSNEFVHKFKIAKYTNPEISTYILAGTDSIEILGIFKENNNHFIISQIAWNSCDKITDCNTIHKKSIFILKRNINSKTDVTKCFTSTHCINCGAPETYNSSNFCEYCHTAVNDENKDWILTDIFNYSDSKTKLYIEKAKKYDKETIKTNLKNNTANLPIKESESNISKRSSNIPVMNDEFGLLGKYSAKDLLRLCIAIMLADGIVDQKELDIIRKICKRGLISEEMLQSYIKEMLLCKNPIEYALETVSTNLDKDLLNVLIKIAASDGNIDESEYKVLYIIALKMKMSRRELMDEINKVYEIKWNNR